MRIIQPAAVLAVLLLGGAAAAQRSGPPAQPASGAPVGRVGPDYTPGWDLMTPKERDAYRQGMLAAPTVKECRRLRDEQLKNAARRANARGIKEVPNPRYDACSDY